MQMPAVALPFDRFCEHLKRTFELSVGKTEQPVTPEGYLDQLYPLDWYLCSGCLDGNEHAWDTLFAARTGRSDCLLVDALKARAVRMYPRDEEKQDGAVSEFWGHLLTGESEGSLPVLARYDGLRPLVPWLIRVFQNLHLTRWRQRKKWMDRAILQADQDFSEPLPASGDDRWHEAFVLAAREWISELTDKEVLLLGLRWRYGMSQRDIATLLGVNEGNVSRPIKDLRERCLTRISQMLRDQDWTGDDVSDYI
jgi:RNA polymerase sigma factor (sigma-70 family)